jgi:hypothetical protein
VDFFGMKHLVTEKSKVFFFLEDDSNFSKHSAQLYILTLWNIALLEKHIVPQLVEKFPEFVDILSFLFRTARHWNLLRIRRLQSHILTLFI